MKPLRNRIHGTRAVILFLALMSCGPAWGGILDLFRSPAALIMNQNNCTYMPQNYSGGIAGEMLNGKFIFSPAGGAVVVIMSMETLDDNRVVARIEQGENRQTLVLDVKKSEGAVTANYNTPSAALAFVKCRL